MFTLGVDLIFTFERLTSCWKQVAYGRGLLLYPTLVSNWPKLWDVSTEHAWSLKDLRLKSSLCIWRRGLVTYQYICSAHG